MILPLGALDNPFFNDGKLILFQLQVRINGRHPFVFIFRRNPPPPLTVLQASSLEGLADSIFEVQPQIRFTIGFSGSVALKAILRKDWPDIAMKMNRIVALPFSRRDGTIK